jgi:nucleoside-diphosphate-sugar epimerase|eukprot:COSAG06_NODE_4255_length_4427_cov_99.139325_1_plen_582_part_00
MRQPRLTETATGKLSLAARTATLNHRPPPPVQQPEPEPELEPEPTRHSMRVLLTGCNTPFGSALAEYLSSLEGCELRLTDRTEQPGDPRTRLPDEFWLSQLDDSESTHALLAGVDQVIHAEPLVAGDASLLEEDAWCDISTRCTYNLCHAAAELGVSRVICLSSMSVFNSVDARYVTPGPNWQARPRPTPAELGPHLAEFVCREFANSDAVPVAVARLGEPLDDPDSVPLASRPRFWTATKTAVEAVSAMLFEQPPPPGAGDGNSGFFVGGGVANMFHPHRRIFTIAHVVDAEPGGLPPPPVLEIVPVGTKAPATGDRVVLYGANGMMGPQTVLALRDEHKVRVTDISSPEDKDQIERLAAAGDPIDFDGEQVVSAVCDIADKDSVWEAAEGASVLVICAVSRWQRRSSFDVNARGVLNALTAAIAMGHERFITTGPHWTHSGAQEQLALNYGISEENVPHPGAGLYGMSKGVGYEIAKVYSSYYSIHVQCHVYNGIGIAAEPGTPGQDGLDLAVTFADAGRAVKAGIDVDLARLPSKCELFYISADLPHGKYSTTKAKEILGWEAQDTLEAYFLRPDAKL